MIRVSVKKRCGVDGINNYFMNKAEYIALLYTNPMLCQGAEACLLIQKVITVTPGSLVKYWQGEIEKWLDGRVKAIVVDSGNKQQVDRHLQSFTETQGKCLTLLYSF